MQLPIEIFLQASLEKEGTTIEISKAAVAQWAMIASATAAIATALSFGGPPALTIVLVLIWGMAVIPDSAQFLRWWPTMHPPTTPGA